VNKSTGKSITASSLTQGYFICIVATTLWSTTGIIISYLYRTYQIPPLVLSFWRDLCVALAVAAVFLLANPLRFGVSWEHLKFLLVYGLVLSVFNSLWTISVDMNGAAISTVLVYSSTAITAVVGWLLFKESLDRIKVTAVLLTMLGCILVSGAYDSTIWNVNALGIFTGLVSGIGFAAYILMGKSSTNKGINPWTTLMYSFGIASIFLLAFNQLSGWLPNGVASSHLLWLGTSIAGWVVLLLLGIGPTVGGFGLYTVSLTYLPASIANLIATLEPVMTAGLAFLLLGERFNTPQWVGSLLIIGSVVLLRLRERE
jgi:drug/metabolite transporter (DMT)-like permease